MASHRVVMKRFVFLVICIAVGASLSGCASSREAFFNDTWIGGDGGLSGEPDAGENNPIHTDGSSGGLRNDHEEGTDSRGWLPDR